MVKIIERWCIHSLVACIRVISATACNDSPVLRKNDLLFHRLRIVRVLAYAQGTRLQSRVAL